MYKSENIMFSEKSQVYLYKISWSGKFLKIEGWLVISWGWRWEWRVLANSNKRSFWSDKNVLNLGFDHGCATV